MQGPSDSSNPDQRVFMRADVPEGCALTVELGPLGWPPTTGTPIDISRGGVRLRTEGPIPVVFGEEVLVRFRGDDARVVPPKTFGFVRRIEERGDHVVVALEFFEPLEELAF